MITDNNRTRYRKCAARVTPQSRENAPRFVDIYQRISDGEYFVGYEAAPNVYFTCSQPWAFREVLEYIHNTAQKGAN